MRSVLVRANTINIVVTSFSGESAIPLIEDVRQRPHYLPAALPLSPPTTSSVSGATQQVTGKRKNEEALQPIQPANNNNKKRQKKQRMKSYFAYLLGMPVPSDLPKQPVKLPTMVEAKLQPFRYLQLERVMDESYIIKAMPHESHNVVVILDWAAALRLLPTAKRRLPDNVALLPILKLNAPESLKAVRRALRVTRPHRLLVTMTTSTKPTSKIATTAGMLMAATQNPSRCHSTTFVIISDSQQARNVGRFIHAGRPGLWAVVEASTKWAYTSMGDCLLSGSGSPYRNIDEVLEALAVAGIVPGLRL